MCSEEELDGTEVLHLTLLGQEGGGRHLGREQGDLSSTADPKLPGRQTRAARPPRKVLFYPALFGNDLVRIHLFLRKQALLKHVQSALVSGL